MMIMIKMTECNYEDDGYYDDNGHGEFNCSMHRRTLFAQLSHSLSYIFEDN